MSDEQGHVIFGEYPRDQRVGHSCNVVTVLNERWIRCVCGWYVRIMPGTKDMAEEAAYHHLRTPDLLIAGTADTDKAARLARLDKLEHYREY